MLRLTLIYAIIQKRILLVYGTDTCVATDVSCHAGILMAPSIRRLYETEWLGGGGGGGDL